MTSETVKKLFIDYEDNETKINQILDRLDKGDTECDCIEADGFYLRGGDFEYVVKRCGNCDGYMNNF